MKRILSVLIVLSAFFVADAQVSDVQKYEFEFSSGVSFPLDSYHGGTSKIGVSGFELAVRRNLENSPWDYGALLQLNCTYRDFKHTGGDYYQNNRTTTLGVWGGYNFRQGAKVNPYAGLAVGLAHNDVVGDKFINTSGNTVSFIPKVGVELWHHLRIGAQFVLSRKGYNSVGLTVGVVLGGRAKK